MARIQSRSFDIVNALEPVGPAIGLFIAGVSLFEITDFEPPLQRVTILGVNLPDPDTFGPFDAYAATITATNDPSNVIANFILFPTIDQENWVGSLLLEFGGTLFPMEVSVRPVQEGDTREGAVILQGPVISADDVEVG